MTTKKKTPTPDRNDFANTASNIAAGFMMASAMDRFNRGLTWKRALFTFTVLPSGKLEIGGQWIDFLRRRFHEGEAIGIKLVDRLFGRALLPDEPFSHRVDYFRDGSVEITKPREHNFRSKFPLGVSIPPRPASATDKLWGLRRLCFCPDRKAEQYAGHRFCEHCGGSVVPLTFHCDACKVEWSMDVGKVIDDKIYCPTCYTILTPAKS